MAFDVNEIAALFHIHAEASKHGNNLRHIRDNALEQLQKINAEHAPPANARPLTPSEPEDGDGEPAQIERRI